VNPYRAITSGPGADPPKQSGGRRSASFGYRDHPDRFIVITLITGSAMTSIHRVPRWAAYMLTCADLEAMARLMPSGPIPA
jgi:hypothetical protein